MTSGFKVLSFFLGTGKSWFSLSVEKTMSSLLSLLSASPSLCTREAIENARALFDRFAVLRLLGCLNDIFATWRRPLERRVEQCTRLDHAWTYQERWSNKWILPLANNQLKPFNTAPCRRRQEANCPIGFTWPWHSTNIVRCPSLYKQWNGFL